MQKSKTYLVSVTIKAIRTHPLTGAKWWAGIEPPTLHGSRDQAALAGRPCSAGEPHTEMIEDLDRRPLEHGCDTMRKFPEQHDAGHGDVIGRDATEPGQHLVGADELPAVQPPGKGDEQLDCLVLGRGEEVMRRGHAYPSWPGAAVRPDSASYAQIGGLILDVSASTLSLLATAASLRGPHHHERPAKPVVRWIAPHGGAGTACTDLDRCGGQGRDRTADLAVLSRVQLVQQRPGCFAWPAFALTSRGPEGSAVRDGSRSCSSVQNSWQNAGRITALDLHHHRELGKHHATGHRRALTEVRGDYGQPLLTVGDRCLGARRGHGRRERRGSGL